MNGSASAERTPNPRVARRGAGAGRVLACLAALAVAGCDRSELLAVVGGESGRPMNDDAPNGAGSDASLPVAPEDAGTLGDVPDAAPDAGASSVRRVEELSDPEARDTDPSFTADRLELFFVSDRSGKKTIWRATRASVTAAWADLALVPELDIGGQNENPSISGDGLRIWFFSDRDRGLGSLWHARRADRSEPFGEAVPHAEFGIAEGSSDVAVAVSDDELLAISSSKLPGDAPYQLYQAARTDPEEAFGVPVLIDELVSDSDDFDPDLREGGLFVGFDSDRLGLPQIFSARRPSLEAPFEPAAPISALVSNFSDGAPAFSEDLGYVMFSSDRDGSVDLYEAMLP